MGVLGDTFAEETGVADIVKFFCSEVVVSCSREIRGSDVYFQRQEVAFRVTDADVVRACTIGNRAVASRGSFRLSPRRKSKEPLSRRVNSPATVTFLLTIFTNHFAPKISVNCPNFRVIKTSLWRKDFCNYPFN